MTEQSIQTAAHKMVYILVVEQSLRAGEGMSEKALAADLQRHGIGEGERQSALDWAVGKGWLEKAEGDEVRLTEAGFDMNFTQYRQASGSGCRPDAGPSTRRLFQIDAFFLFACPHASAQEQFAAALHGQGLAGLAAVLGQVGIGARIPVLQKILQGKALRLVQLRVLLQELLQILARILLQLLARGRQRDIADVIVASAGMRAQQIAANIVAPGLTHGRVLAEFLEQAEGPHALNSLGLTQTGKLDGYSHRQKTMPDPSLRKSFT